MVGFFFSYLLKLWVTSRTSYDKCSKKKQTKEFKKSNKQTRKLLPVSTFLVSCYWPSGFSSCVLAWRSCRTERPSKANKTITGRGFGGEARERLAIGRYGPEASEGVMTFSPKASQVVCRIDRMQQNENPNGLTLPLACAMFPAATARFRHLFHLSFFYYSYSFSFLNSLNGRLICFNFWCWAEFSRSPVRVLFFFVLFLFVWF